MKKQNKKILILLFQTALLLNSFFASAQETATEKKAFDWDRVVVGGNLGAQIGRITIVEVSPNIGYKLTENLLAGIGGTYLYYQDNDFDYSTNIYGGRLFGDYFILENFIAHAEYEVLNLEVNVPTATHEVGDRISVGSLLVGGGVRTTMGSNAFASILLLYNLNESLHSPYSNPILRIGFGIAL